MTPIPDHVPDDLHAPTKAPDYTHSELVDFANTGHDFEAPGSGFNRARMALTAVEMAPAFCRHCAPALRLRPMTGTAWGIEWFHADACPEADR